jgi:hypothetical protein
MDSAAFVRAEQFTKMAERRSPSAFDQWLAYSREFRKDPSLLAYYTFESVGARGAVLPNVSAAGSALDGRIEGGDWVYGRWPGKWALCFHGARSGDKVVLPEPRRFDFTGPFSVAVWFRVGQFRGDAVSALISKGGVTWRLQRWGTSNSLSLDSVMAEGDFVRVAQHTDVVDHRWHLAVAVIEPLAERHVKHLYVDGRLEAQWDMPLALGRSNAPVLIGECSIVPDRGFEGLIDEVAILARKLSAEEVEAMYRAGNPIGPSVRESSNEK